MWIFLNNAFLSVVDPAGKYKGGGGPASRQLLVRARIKGDIEAVFPQAVVTETPERDYRFRALVDRILVADAMAASVMMLDYQNFKGSVPEQARHDAYAGVWGVMHREQERRARPPKAARQKSMWDDHDDYAGGRINRRR